ncbi:MAG: hypothetical protein ACM36C_10900 [Acidobacteriota bacterium]
MPTTRRYRINVPTALLLALAVCPAVAAQKKVDGVAVAREAYNKGSLDAAIDAARSALEDPRTSTEARIVLGRALIERFRRTAQPEDLDSARTALLEAGASPLSSALRVEWLIGSAQVLYFEEQFGAAATLLGSLLADPRSDQAVPGGRDRLLDWWATAEDRVAQTREATARRVEYSRLSRRLAEELERDPTLATAAYWQVVAARGEGDVDRAWELAQAAWVRAPLAPDRGAQLRADLDRIVTQALIPERARRSAGRDQEKQVSQSTALRDAWESFKLRWTPK